MREVWLVDCQRKVVFTSQAGAEPDLVQEDVLLWGPPAAPEPVPIDLAEIFRGLD